MAPDSILGETILLFILSYPSHLSIDLLISTLLRLFTFTEVTRRWFQYIIISNGDLIDVLSVKIPLSRDIIHNQRS